MKVYISGPITGVEDYEDFFYNRAELLKEHGYIPVNPVVIGKRLCTELGRTPSYEEYLQADMKALMECEGISMLSGWENSAGATKEREVAIEHGKIFVDIFPLKDWED
jgi:hypothetical protein